MSSFHWLMGLHPYPYPSTLRFSPNGMMPCLSSEPHLTSSLTASSLDKWSLLATQNVPSVLHPSRCLEKYEIPTASEFDEIRHGSYISQDDSNGEVRFVIRDLEKIRILTEITILSFLREIWIFSGSHTYHQSALNQIPQRSHPLYEKKRNDPDPWEYPKLDQNLTKLALTPRSTTRRDKEGRKTHRS